MTDGHWRSKAHIWGPPLSGCDVLFKAFFRYALELELWNTHAAVAIAAPGGVLTNGPPEVARQRCEHGRAVLNSIERADLASIAFAFI